MLAGAPTEFQRPEPPPGARNLVIVVLDSLRYDTWTAARLPNLSRLGEVARRFSYASWTAPSHYNLMMGLLPHASPAEVNASDYYKQDLLRFADRLQVDSVSFQQMLPALYLPLYLRDVLGYTTHAMVSMPVLNPATPFNRGFDTFELMPTHNDLDAMVDGLRFGDRPSFHLLNAGETHYPYAIPGEDPSEWPRISGLHGVLKKLHIDGEETPFFDDASLARLRGRQLRALTYVDTVFERLFDLLPPNTWLIVTSDHGELFGEEGYFGHGPIAHLKVLEVPLVEGMLR
ncbi:MAG: sulfatase-like hydrolase/transferase [Candidatus Dormibacteria bacterium]